MPQLADENTKLACQSRCGCVPRIDLLFAHSSTLAYTQLNCEGLLPARNADPTKQPPNPLSLYVSARVEALLRFSCREENLRHADSQIIRWEGRLQGDDLHQRCRRRTERLLGLTLALTRHSCAKGKNPSDAHIHFSRPSQ